MDIEKEKQFFLLEFLKNVPFDGWTKTAIELTSKKKFLNDQYGTILFPDGCTGLAKYFSYYIDQQMKERLIDVLNESRIRDKIKKIVMLRFELYGPHKEAIRALIKSNLNPLNIPSSVGMLWHTSDNFWRSIGDQSVDYSYYSKRVLLSCVYSACLLYWLNDASIANKDTSVFLEKQIDKVLKLGKIKNTVKNMHNKITKIPFLRLIIRRRKI